jgi:glycosyltransferase involved in cell wall biosynthesis
MSIEAYAAAESAFKGTARSKAGTLKIAIDAITPGASLDSRAGGMRMYLTALTAKMSEQEPGVEFVVLESRQFPLTELEGLPNVTRLVCPGVPRSRAGRVIYQNSALPIYLRGLRADAFLATCNVLPLGCPLPTVVVVQSLQYFDHPEAYGRLRGAYLRAALRYASRHAQSLICVSGKARDELIRLTGINRSKVSVIYHGVSPVITSYVHEITHSPPPYILCVATAYRYKNLERLIEAFALLKRESRIPHRLRIVGGEADMSIADLALGATRLGVGDQVDFTGPIPHNLIPAEYRRASVFVYPSLAETFGHPPLEAMAMGVPVVASSAGPIPEIVGEAAELVDPLDVIDIARGLWHVLGDSTRAQDLVRLGRRRAADFSWEASARKTFQIIQSIRAQWPN